LLRERIFRRILVTDSDRTLWVPPRADASGSFFAHIVSMIYRKIDGMPVSETGARAPESKQGATAGPQTLASNDASGDDTMARRRRQTPVGDPLPMTFRWVAKLPRSVQPLALLRQYPRIANMMAGMWQDPPSYRSYLHDLLTDRRGNRKGFAQEIVQELVRLRVHYENLHPPVLDVYKDVNKRG
jgi:hypothetical protein